MKKVLLASLFAMAATTATAAEIGLTGTRDYSGDNRNFGGVTLSQSFGKVNATVGFERSTVGDNDQNRWSLVGGYDLVKLGAVTLTPKVGVAYLDNQNGSDGYAATVGIGASVPVVKNVTFGVDFARQYGQDRVESFDGNRVTVSIRHAF
jgi:hypothetical protein